MNVYTRQLPLRSIAFLGGLLICLCAPAVWAQETPTATPVAETPTATPVVETPTATPVVETPTATPIVETPTATPTEVPESPTSTPTQVPESPTATPTEVPESPTATPTEVPESPTATPTEEPAFPLQMSVDDVAVTATQDFEVVINAGGYENVDAIQFDISFNPPAANFVGLVPPTEDDAINAFLTESIPAAPGKVSAAVVGDVIRISAIGGIADNPARLNSISSPDEVVQLLRLTFTAIDIPEVSRTSTITISNVKDDLAGAELTAGVLTIMHLESPTATPTTKPETAYRNSDASCSADSNANHKTGNRHRNAYSHRSRGSADGNAYGNNCSISTDHYTNGYSDASAGAALQPVRDLLLQVRSTL